MSQGAQTGAAYPGKGLSLAGMIIGICSVVLSIWLGFILGVLAIIFSAIGLRKKKNGFAIAGLVTGIVGVVISLIVGFFIIVAAYTAIQKSSQDASVKSAAVVVQKQAEIFDAEYNAYPSFSDMQYYLSLKGYDGIVIGEQGMGSGADIIYIPCYGYGAIVWHWSMEDEEFKSLYAGLTDQCEWND